MVRLREIKEEESSLLAKLIDQDDQLKRELSFPDHPGITAEDMHRDIQDWQKAKSAICYGIIQGKQITGMIFLSHHNEIRRTARIGYWIGSGHWGARWRRGKFLLHCGA